MKDKEIFLRNVWIHSAWNVLKSETCSRRALFVTSRTKSNVRSTYNFVGCDYFGWRRSVLIVRVWRRASFAASAGGPRGFWRRGWGCRGLRFLFWVFRIFHQLVLLGAAVVAQRVVFIQVFLVSASLKSHKETNRRCFCEYSYDYSFVTLIFIDVNLSLSNLTSKSEDLKL